MLPVYVGALALGGALIAASILLGGGKDAEAGGDHDGDGGLDGHDHDLSHDHDADLSHDHDHALAVSHVSAAADGPWLPFLSLRFWTFALACFGLAGLGLSLVGLPQVVVAPVSALLGLALGWATAAIFRRLQRDAVSGTIHLHQQRGAEARVLLAVGPHKLGKVRLLVDGQDVDLPARTSDPHLIEPGRQALVVEVQDGVAIVTSVPQLPKNTS